MNNAYDASARLSVAIADEAHYTVEEVSASQEQHSARRGRKYITKGYKNGELVLHAAHPDKQNLIEAMRHYKELGYLPQGDLAIELAKEAGLIPKKSKLWSWLTGNK